MAAQFTTLYPELLLNDGSFPDMFFQSGEILPLIYPHQEPEFSEMLEEKNPQLLFSDSSNQKMSAAASSCGDSNENFIKRGGNSYLGKGKRARNYDNESEVVHVRARRGQATDKHSLAERVRRGKINEKLKCLHDIVPGCYKTMGMSVMLDETINYVQSLQSQVEFLSMKLTAASTFYDFNSEPDYVESPSALISSSTLYNWSET